MKIEIELPDWCEGKNIRIMAGVEMAAFKLVGGEWKIKDTRCQRCGACCVARPENDIIPNIDGKCIHLVLEPGTTDRYKCNIALYRPWNCCFDPSNRERIGCKITYLDEK